MSKRSHRKKVKGNPCPIRKGIFPKTFTETKQYTNNKRRKYAFEEGNMTEVLIL